VDGFALAGVSLVAKLASTASALASKQAFGVSLALPVFSSTNPPDEDIAFTVSEGQLNARWWSTSGTAIPYSSTSHKWVRIWEQAGTVHWDTSPDGVTWSSFMTAATSAVEATPIGTNSLYAVLSGYTFGPPAPVTEVVGFSDFTLGYLGPVLGVDAVVLSSSGLLLSSLQTTATFSYGDSVEKIREGVVAAVQSAAGDLTLDVSIIGA
jgi:hypothetical protein